MSAVRLFARFFVLLAVVLGTSLAFAWAWDRSDVPPSAGAPSPTLGAPAPAR